MKNNRMEQIIESLNGLGTEQNIMYTNQEIVQHLTELQGAMARVVFEKSHAENLRDQDIMIHFEALANEYGLDKSDTYIRFKHNMNELGYTIGSFIKGMNGERIAKRSLKLLSYDKSIRILYNIQLEDNDTQAEYDAIVIAPYGMFVIEVKNWSAPMTISSKGLLTRNDYSGIVYDIPGRMSIKEALLKEYLQDLFPENYHNMLLLSNEKAQIQDNYHQISVSCGGGISYEIKSYDTNDKTLSDEQIIKIANTILANHKEQRTLCNIKCDEIIVDYARLMAQIEAASSRKVEELSNSATTIVKDTFEVNVLKKRPWVKYVNLGSVAACFAALVIPNMVSAIITHKH